MTPPSSLRAAAVQLTSTDDTARNVETAERLVKAVAGHPEWSAAAEELLATFETPEMKMELALTKKLDSLMNSLLSIT